MAVVGIDLGSQSTKAVILEGDEILGGASLATGESAETEARVGKPVLVPENPQIVEALGAALFAQRVGATC
jgi:activator of 2-hydroxyglutaryl-CoA dehydratase